MPTDAAIPTKPQIERQLVRMLENEIFASRPQRARLLDYLVRNTLAGKDVMEKSIRAELYPARSQVRGEPNDSSTKYEEDSTVVRRTVDLLRKSLAEYYSENSHDALVVIYLPEQPAGRRIKFQAGEAYKPRFGYNIHHEVSKNYLLGCHHLRSGFINRIPDAVVLFGKVLEEEPEHVGAMLSLADALCFSVGLGIEPERHEDMIGWADSLIGRAMSYAPEFWHSHASRALVHYCRKEFGDGQREFRKALRMNREETENCGYYFLFLAVSGRAQDALQLTEFVTAEQIDNPVIHANHGLLLASVGRYGQAQNAFERALELDRNCWIAHLGAMRLNMARGEGSQAQEHAERAKALLDADEYAHWMAIINALHPSD